MLIRNFDVRKLVRAVWDEKQFDFEDYNDPVTEIKESYNIWGLAGIPAPDQDEHDENKEQC